jgi:transcriptional regulator with XRE-family HTH domain
MEGNQEALTLQKAQNAMAFIEQMELLVTGLEGLSGACRQEDKPELQALTGRAKSLFEMINEGEAEFKLISDGNKTLSKVAPSRIERMGLGREIIRLRTENKLKIEEIANRFDLSVYAVSQFLKAYEKAKPLEQARMRRTSIFDTQAQYETLGAQIHILLGKVQGIDNQVSVQVLGELRKTIESAEKFMARLSDQQKVDKIRQIVMEVLMDELPEKRIDIMKRFQELDMGRHLASASLPA